MRDEQAEYFRAVAMLYDTAMVGTKVIMSLSKPIEGTTPRVGPNILKLWILVNNDVLAHLLLTNLRHQWQDVNR